MTDKKTSSGGDDGGHNFALPKGTKLFDFEIEKVLGHGGFGITYLATDTVLEETVAVKEYFPNDLAGRVSDATVRSKSGSHQGEFKAGLKAFLEEARLIARLRHPNIIQVRRFFELHGTGYIVLNYEPGQTLSKRLGKGTLPEAELRRILSGLLDGLETVHERAILHRDLKPSNIILRSDGTPVLIDFGAARDFKGRHSRSITAIAAPGYSPPEQYGVGGQQGPWTDLYALGAIAYRCVTGKAPADSLRRLRNDPWVPATKAASGKYGAALLKTIDWMLRVEETERPSSAEQVKAALQGSVVPDAKASTPTASRKAKVAAFDKEAGSNRPLLLAGGAIGVVLLAGIAATASGITCTTFGLMCGDKTSTVASNLQTAPATASRQAPGAGQPNTQIASVPAATSAPASGTPIAVPMAPGTDEAAWNLLKDSKDAEQLKNFLKQFPTSQRQSDVVARLEVLEPKITDCDRLAANPDDPHKVAGVPGVKYDLIDVPAAMQACERAIKDFPDAARIQYQLGRVYNIDKKYDDAGKWYEKATELGYSDAMFELSLFYQYGLGRVSEDLNEYNRLVQKAAESGSPRAMFILGNIYEFDRHEYVEARRWYAKSAELGLKLGMYNLAVLYFNGKGGPRNHAEARKLLINLKAKAAEDGDDSLTKGANEILSHINK